MLRISDSGPEIDNKPLFKQRKIPAKFAMTLRALRHRNYRLFFSGQLFSLIGTWMQMAAQSWLVYRLTGSSLMLGSVGFASQIPVFLLAFVVELVEKEDLMNAIALNSSAFNGARVIGPAIAGILIAVIGDGWCFFINGVSFSTVIAGLLLMKLKPRESVKSDGSAISNVLEGLRYVRHTKPFRALLLLMALVSVMGMQYSVLIPIFADKILHGGARGLGILMGATGFGALAGSMSIAARSSTRGLGRLVGFACVGFGASLTFFSLSRNFWLSVLFMVPVGFSFMVLMASTNTLLQLMVPDRLRGRVMAMHVMMFMGMLPFGSLLAGAVAAKVGAPLTVLMGAVLCLVGSGIFMLRLSKLQLGTSNPIRTHVNDSDYI